MMKKGIKLLLGVMAMFVATITVNAKTCKVTFVTNGGSEIAPVELACDSYLEDVPTSKRDNYTFAGWYSDSELSFPKMFQYDMITEDVTVYAKWYDKDHVINSVGFEIKGLEVGDKLNEYGEGKYGYSLVALGSNYNNTSGRFISDFPSKSATYDMSPTGTLESNKDYYFELDGVSVADGYFVSPDASITFLGYQVSAVETNGFGMYFFKLRVAPEGEAPTEGEGESKEEAPKAKVVAKDDTPEDKAVKEEISKVINDIIAGKEVKGVSKELQEAIQQAYEADPNVTITIDVTTPSVKEDEVSEDAKKIKELAGDNAKVAGFFDINVNVLINGETVGKITELANGFKLTLKIPENLPAVKEGYARTFTISLVHGGKAKSLDTTLNADGTVSGTGTEFSTYAITYVDEKVKEETTEKKAATKEEQNPNTADNIMLSVILATVSIIGLLVVITYNKKANN